MTASRRQRRNLPLADEGGIDMSGSTIDVIIVAIIAVICLATWQFMV
jgi:hypothetical protein